MTTPALIWDLDGVIADTAPFHLRSWRLLAEENGFTFTDEDFRRGFGKRNPEIIQETFGPGFTDAESERLSRRKEELFRELAGDSVRPFPGVIELMRSLESGGWKQAIASSTPIENVELLTTALRIADFFEAVVSDQDVVHGKPDPECFLAAAQRLSVPAKMCVVIEDAVAGVQAAVRAGMKCVAVTNTRSRNELEEADLVVDSLQGVDAEVLESLLRPEG